MRSKEVIRKLEKAGWRKVRQTGSHCHYHHPSSPGTVTVPHPQSEMGVGTLKSIERQSGLKLR